MRKAAGVISIVLLLSVSTMAQERALELDNFKVRNFEENRDVIRGFKINKIGMATFYGSLACLWATTAMDIHSGQHLDKTRFHEVNPFGGGAGQITTSALTTGAAFFIQRYSGRRARWIATALLAGASAGHAFGAIHNYGLK